MLGGSMSFRAHSQLLKPLTLLVVVYLTCDGLWLIGDNALWLGEAYRPLIRVAAHAFAFFAFGGMAIFLAMRTSIVLVAVISSTGIIGASLLIVPIGMIWFPSQFPRDSSVPQFIIWVSIELLMLSGVAAIVAAALATLAR